MRTILESTADTTKAIMNVSKAEYDQYSKIAKDAKAEFDAYVSANGADESDVYY
jgi:hypothetical protein